MKPSTSDPPPATPSVRDEVPSRQTMVAVVALVCAAWVLSGGCGLLGRPLASGLTWCALAVVSAAFRPNRDAGLRAWAVLAFGLIVAVLAAASASDVIGLAGLAVCAASLSIIAFGLNQRILRVAAQAIAILALYRFALTSIPFVWHSAEMIGSALGATASAFWGRPLSVGATFAGLDHLVLMAALVVGWTLQLKPPRTRPVLLALSAIVIGQALYLLCLSLTTELATALPTAPFEPPPDPYVPPDWHWGDAFRSLLPWNLPILATLWHLAVIAAMLRLGSYRPAEPEPTVVKNADSPTWQRWAPAAIVAALLPIVCVLSLGKSDLQDKNILVYDQGYLDWDVPVHDRYGADSSGRFGMLPTFVESLGGQLSRSSELTPEELSTADVLVLIHPNQPWSDELLARVHEYVRSGGSLLVAAGPRRQDSGTASTYNDVLEPLGMPLRFDTVVSQTEAWRHAMHVASHPTAMGLGDNRDRFGVSAAASIRLPWRASPILAGRWGWSDPGSDFFMTGSGRWDREERLGDLVLAAERRLGKGRVIVLGDTAFLTNQGMIRTYGFTGRLLAYLAGNSGSPQAWWRQVIGLILAGLLIVLWHRPIRSETLAVSLIVLMLASTMAETLSHHSWRVLPDGRKSTPNNLAYLDASHLEAYAESPWTPDGVDGLALTLMRNGFLVLAADDLGADRLARAGMLVSVGPAQTFTRAERKRIKTFVDNGGVLIAMAGAQHGRKLNDALEPFGLRVPVGYRQLGAENDDALPLGSLYRSYPNGEILSAVVFHSAWPLITFPTEDAKTIFIASTEARQPGNWDPIIACSSSARGIVILIGDTYFGMNKTLENVDGKAMVDNHVNAHFWRWLIGELPGREPWQPPPFNWGGGDSESSAAETAGDEEAQP